MTRDQILAELAEFFRDSFREDAAGVGDWFAQGDHDIDEFVLALDRECPPKGR